MPAGRPKVTVAPCPFCGKTFRRREHLLRHERTHTHEKPYNCDCGQSFTRQDLLTRHVRLSHSSRAGSGSSPETPSPGMISTSEPTPLAFESAQPVVNELDFLWDPQFTSMDIFPPTLFDDNFLFQDSSLLSKTVTPPMNSFARFSSKLPSLEDDEDLDGDEVLPAALQEDDGVVPEACASATPWTISASDYDRIRLEVNQYATLIPSGCSLPSQNTLVRYLEKYFLCAHEFLPFLHPATFSASRLDVELVLAVAALGSIYLYEHSVSHQLYYIAKAILVEKIRQQELQLATEVLLRQDGHTSQKRDDLGRVQVLICLASFASWAHRKILPDALSMAGQLVALVRENNISESDRMSHDVNWTSWISIEERRRTLLAAYVLVSLQSIAFNTPPPILNCEIGLYLPGCADQWNAKTSASWNQNPRAIERGLQDGLDVLLKGSGIPSEACVSGFGNYLLIHGLLQHIYVAKFNSAGVLDPDTMRRFETALRLWQSSWEHTHESSLDPLSPESPFGLTAAALLRLAYLALASDYCPCQGLMLKDIRQITNRHFSVERSPRVDRAVLHAAHALSIPVRTGIAFVAAQKTFIRSIEDSICSLQCALMLKDWLEMISNTVQLSDGEGRLRKAEMKLLGIIKSIIRETFAADSLDVVEDEASHYRRMAKTVAALWAKTFQGVHVLEIDYEIGTGLQLLAGD